MLIKNEQNQMKWVSESEIKATSPTDQEEEAKMEFSISERNIHNLNNSLPNKLVYSIRS